MIPAEEKAANVKIFKKEDAFYQYMERYLTRNGYVLLITTPLKKKMRTARRSCPVGSTGKIENER